MQQCYIMRRDKRLPSDTRTNDAINSVLRVAGWHKGFIHWMSRIIVTVNSVRTKPIFILHSKQVLLFLDQIKMPV
jgi:hypothetical protein